MPDGAIALFQIRTTGVKSIGFGFNPSDDWDVLKQWNDAAAIIKLWALMAGLACESDGCNYSSSFPRKISSSGGKLGHSRESIAQRLDIEGGSFSLHVCQSD